MSEHSERVHPLLTTFVILLLLSLSLLIAGVLCFHSGLGRLLAGTCFGVGLCVGFLNRRTMRDHWSAFSGATTLPQVQTAFRIGRAGKVASALLALGLLPGIALAFRDTDALFAIGSLGALSAGRFAVILRSLKERGL